jgi:dolichol-phosphate mannosyltransferase
MSGESVVGEAAFAARARRGEALLVALSICVQVLLALALGHAYDVPVFMGGGYLAATGGDPYAPHDLSGVFGNPFFAHLTSVGYPPPWLLVLALAYRLSYGIVRNIFLYNLAIKVPVIAANVCLAFAARRLARDAGAREGAAAAGFLFILFNPLLLYTTAAWGQFDSLVALFALLSLWLLWRGRTLEAAILLALAFSLKPTVLPLLPLSVIYVGRTSARRALRFGLALLLSTTVLCAGPFLFFGWSLAPILRGWDAHFVVAGGLSWLTSWELIANAYSLPASLQFLGYLWLPALAAGLLFIKRRGDGLADLSLWALRLMLLFFLTRAWLSEPNVDQLLPLALVAACAGRLGKRTLAALWMIPLAFTLFNVSLPQLMFLFYPGVMEQVAKWDRTLRAGRLVGRALIVIPWLVVGWRIVLFAGEARVRAVAPVPLTDQGASAVQPLVSLILPTYNESETIARVISECSAVFRDIRAAAEIIVVDDDSPDGTAEAARRAGERLRAADRASAGPQVRILRREGKRGLSTAILDGMAAARGEVLAVMDADMQHPPVALALMHESILKGDELAVMSRYVAGSSAGAHALPRRMASRCAVSLAHLCLPRTRAVRDPVSGCFMVRRSVLAGVGLSPMGFKILPDLLVRGKYARVTELPYVFHAREGGRSKMRPSEGLLYLRLLFRLRKAEPR